MADKREAQIRDELQRRQEEIELLRELAQQQGLAFSAPSEEHLRRKIKREGSSSPYIYSMSWTSGTARGAIAYYNIWYANADPVSYSPMIVTLFFGLGNFTADILEAWGARDLAWPSVSSPSSVLGPNPATGTQAFTYTVPTSVPAGTYLGNAVLWVGQYHDMGTYFDRGLFPITVT